MSILERFGRRNVFGDAVVRILAVLAGVTLGAMLASFAATPGAPPLPSRKEALDLAVLVLPDHPFDTEWFNDSSAEDLGSREHADFSLSVPDWLQVLVGDYTQAASTGVVWLNEGEPPGTGTAYLASAADRLRAAGWEVDDSAPPYVVSARKGTLLLEFSADDYAAPELDIVRVPPAWHRWAVLAGAVLGGVAAGLLARVIRRRDLGEEGHTSNFLLLLGLVALLPSFLVLLAATAFELAWHPWIDIALWRTGRFVPFGAMVNAGVLLLVVGWVWHSRRYRMGPVEPEVEIEIGPEDVPEPEPEHRDEDERDLVVEADPIS